MGIRYRGDTNIYCQYFKMQGNILCQEIRKIGLKFSSRRSEDLSIHNSILSQTLKLFHPQLFVFLSWCPNCSARIPIFFEASDLFHPLFFHFLLSCQTFSPTIFEFDGFFHLEIPSKCYTWQQTVLKKTLFLKITITICRIRISFPIFKMVEILGKILKIWFISRNFCHHCFESYTYKICHPVWKNCTEVKKHVFFSG